MYLRAAKAEAEEAGESTEGMANSVSKLRESILMLTDQRVDIMLDENTFKSTYEIFRDLAAVWEDMADVDQAALLELIGGKRNSDAVMSLISNFQIAEDALKTANNSAGSAMAENEKRMASIQGRITEFTRSFEEFSARVLDTDLVKTVIDSGSTILDILTEIVNTFGALPPLIATVTGMFTAVQGIHGNTFGVFDTRWVEDGTTRLTFFGNTLSDVSEKFNQARSAGFKFKDALYAALNINFGDAALKIQQYNDRLKVSTENGKSFVGTLSETDSVMKDYLRSLDGGTASLAGYKQYAQQAGASMNTLNIKAKAAAVGVGILNTALNMLISFGVSFAISAIINGIMSLVNAAHEARVASMEAADEAASTASNLNELLDAYVSLGNAMDAGTASRDEYLAAQDEIISALGLEGQSVQELIGDYNSLRDAIAGAASEELARQRRIMQQGAEDARAEAVANMYGPIDSGKYNRIGDFMSGAWVAGVEDEVVEAAKMLIEQGFDGIEINESAGGDAIKVTLPNNVSWAQGRQGFQTYLENAEYINSLMLALEEAGYASGNALYDAVAAGEQAYTNAVSDAVDRADDVNKQVANELIYDLEDTPDTMEEFIATRNQLIENLANSENWDSAGSMTPEEVADSVLGMSSIYGPMMDELRENLALATEVGNAREKIINALAPKDYEQYEVGSDEYTAALEDYYERLGQIDSIMDNMSPEEALALGDAFDSGDIRTMDDVIDFLEDYNSETQVAARRSDELRNKISGMWDSEDFADTRAELTAMVDELGEIDPSVIEELAEEGGVLAEVLEQDGMNAEFLAHVLEETAKGNDGFALITDDALKLNQALEGMKTRFDEVTAAKGRYEQAMSADEYDTNYRSFAEAYATLQEEIAAGTTGSKAFWNSAEYLFGEGQLEQWGWEDGVNSIVAAANKYKSAFGDAEDAGAGFIAKLYQMSQAGELVDENGNELISMVRELDGSLTLDFDESNLDALSEKLGLSKEAVLAVFEALQMYGDIDFYQIEEVLQAIDEIGLGVNLSGQRVLGLTDFEQRLRDIGKNGKEIHDIVKDLQELGGVTFIASDMGLDELVTNLQTLGIMTEKLNEDGSMNLEVKVGDLAGLLNSLDLTQDEAEKVFKKLAEIDNITFTDASGQIYSLEQALQKLSGYNWSTGTETQEANLKKQTDNTKKSVSDLLGLLEDVDDSRFTNVTREIGRFEDGASGLSSALQRAYSYGYSLSKLTFPNAPEYSSPVVKPGNNSYNKGPKPLPVAKGSDNFPGGPALVGEGDGPELVLTKGSVYLAGTNGPEMLDLDRGDTVYNAAETRQIMSTYGRRIIGRIPAFAGGMHGNITPPGFGNSNSNSNSSNSSTNNSISNTTSNVEELDDALQKLDDTINEIIGDYEHQIELMEFHGASTEEIIAVYRQMQEAVHEYADKFRAMGLDENNDYIQELQKQWIDYENSIKDLIAQAWEDAINERDNAASNAQTRLEHALDVGNLIDIKSATGNMIAAYRDAQKLIEQQQEYYLQQGYEMTSDVISDLIEQWWEYEEAVEEAKQTVVDHLIDIVNSSTDAVDEIQNVYDTLKDAANEYAANGGFISVDAFQAIVDLGPEYMQYLRDENGLLKINEESINRVIAAKTRQLALDQAMSYVERLRLALNSQSLEDLNQLLFATTTATDATWGLVYANLALLDLSPEQYQAALHNINAIRALAENAVSGIGQVAGSYSEELDDMKAGLDSILEYVMDMLEDRIERQIDALEDLKDSYSELIELKKESLEAAKEETDYQDEVADKVKEIADLQARINALSLDDSRDAQAEKIKLEEEMAELQKELGETQAEEAIQNQQDSLDAMQEAYEEQKDQEIAALEETISSTQKLYDMAIAYIESHWSTLYQELISWNTQYGSHLNQEISDAWAAALAAAQRYGSYVNALNKIDADIEASQNGSGSNNVTVGDTVTGGDYTNVDMVRAIVTQMKSLSGAWFDEDEAGREKLHEKAAQYAARLPEFGVIARYDDDGWWYIEEDENNPSNVGKRLYSVYHKGGVAGDRPTLKQNETMAILQKGEPVLDKKREEGLYKIIDFTEELSRRLGKAIGTIDTSGLFSGLIGSKMTGLPTSLTPATAGGPQVNFGDVYIYGANDDTVKQHMDVNRKFVNDVLNVLNIRK